MQNVSQFRDRVARVVVDLNNRLADSQSGSLIQVGTRKRLLDGVQVVAVLNPILGALFVEPDRDLSGGVDMDAGHSRWQHRAPNAGAAALKGVRPLG